MGKNIAKVLSGYFFDSHCRKENRREMQRQRMFSRGLLESFVPHRITAITKPNPNLNPNTNQNTAPHNNYH